MICGPGMRAAVLQQPREPLRIMDVPAPRPGAGEVLLRVLACGVCRTDLHIVDGELPPQLSPVIPGHQIVGTVVETGPGATLERRQRVGVPWLAWTCGVCSYCRAGRENLCERARFTGYHVHGGFAEYVVADARYCFPIPDGYADDRAAPLLCAGLIGHRSQRFCDDAKKLGIYGFGAAAHIVTQNARWQGREVYAELLRIAPQVPIEPVVRHFPLEQANAALATLREGRSLGSIVLVP